MNSSSQPSADIASTPLTSTPALILSGLAGQEAVPAWVHSWAATGAARWVPAQELVEAAEGTLAALDVRIIWLYSPPWASPGLETLTLDAWMALQRQVMRLRRLSPESWLLVNVQQVNPTDLARSLEVPVEELNESVGATVETADIDQSLLLARLFDWAAPQAWDLFEALEAASWVGPGQAQPLLREQLPVPDAAALEALQRQLERAATLPALEAEQSARQAQWQQREAELETALDQLRQEAAASAAEMAQVQADAQAQAADLVAERDEARRQLDATQQQLKEAKEEGELLLLQLHQVQEELEQFFLKSKEQETSAANAQSEAAAALAKAHSEHAAQVAALQNEKAQAQAQAADRSNERDEARRQLGASQQQLKDAQEEGELLLLQLHQVQEELERIFLDGKDKEASAARTLAQSRSEIDTLKSELSAEAGKLKAAELKKTELVDALERTRAALTTCQQDIGEAQNESRDLRAKLEAENGELQSALALARAEHQAAMAESRAALHRLETDAAAELDKRELAYKTALESLTQQLAQAHAELEDLRLQHDAIVRTQAEQHSQALQDLQSALLRLRQQHDHLMRELHRAHEEIEAGEQARQSVLVERTALQNELAHAQELLHTRTAELRAQHHALLLELHRAHEDAEASESKHEQAVKEAQRELALARQRISRLKQRTGPQASSVEVEVAGFDTKAAVPWVDWLVLDLDTGDGVQTDVMIRTTVSSAGLGVEPRGSDPHPAFGKGALYPTQLAKARDPEQLALFREISTKAWNSLNKAVAAVSASLSDPSNAAELPGPLALEPWRKALSTLEQDLKRLPDVFRFDVASLRKELVAERYEHLWLQFEGATFGVAPMPAFSIRLAAVTGAPNGFSVLPQLEIPLLPDGKPPFDGWFQVKSDAMGPRLELRADLVRRAFDVRVWNALPGPTQSMLLSVIAALPSALRQMQRSGLKLSRPVGTWIGLIEDMIAVMREELAKARVAATTRLSGKVNTMATVATAAAAAPAAAKLRSNTARNEVLQAPALSPEFNAIPAAKKSKTPAKPVPSKSAVTRKVSPKVAPPATVKAAPKATTKTTSKTSAKATPVKAAVEDSKKAKSTETAKKTVKSSAAGKTGTTPGTPARKKAG